MELRTAELTKMFQMFIVGYNLDREDKKLYFEQTTQDRLLILFLELIRKNFREFSKGDIEDFQLRMEGQ